LDLILFNQPGHGDVVAKALGTRFNERTNSLITRVRDGELIGGVIYDSYTHESIMAHIAGWEDRWLNRDLLWVMFDYPFNQMGVKRIFAQVQASNHHAIEFDHKLGFRDVAEIEGVYPGNVSAIIMRMDREDCRWLNIKTNYFKKTVN
jgi:RimJ/RimL family protein N-acetyltransferase